LLHKEFVIEKDMIVKNKSDAVELVDDKLNHLISEVDGLIQANNQLNEENLHLKLEHNNDLNQANLIHQNLDTYLDEIKEEHEKALLKMSDLIDEIDLMNLEQNEHYSRLKQAHFDDMKDYEEE